MPTPAFHAALPFVLRWEGGYVHHPDDPGGATNKGVTQRVYDGWRAGEGLGLRSVRLIEDDEVRAIYQTGYWLPPHCDDLRSRLDLVQFDTAVNMGVGRAGEAYYRRLALTRPSLAVFLKGWLNRLNALRGETGLVTLESAQALDFGDTGYVAKVPDLGLDPDYDI